MINTLEISQTKLSDMESNNLAMYLELGHNAASKGDENEAKNWYSTGLKIAKQLGDISIEKEFTRFLYTMF